MQNGEHHERLSISLSLRSRCAARQGGRRRGSHADRDAGAGLRADAGLIDHAGHGPTPFRSGFFQRRCKKPYHAWSASNSTPVQSGCRGRPPVALRRSAQPSATKWTSWLSVRAASVRCAASYAAAPRATCSATPAAHYSCCPASQATLPSARRSTARPRLRSHWARPPDPRATSHRRCPSPEVAVAARALAPVAAWGSRGPGTGGSRRRAPARHRPLRSRRGE
jgi:hypothetical protein